MKTLNKQFFALSILGRADLRILASFHLAPCSAAVLLGGPGSEQGPTKLFNREVAKSRISEYYKSSLEILLTKQRKAHGRLEELSSSNIKYLTSQMQASLLKFMVLIVTNETSQILR